MAELCREFGIARKTGYKIFDRYQECGLEGLTDRSRRRYHYAHQLPFQVENFILNVKREHGSWGARKIRERLIRRFSGIQIPAKSTIHAVLDRYGLVERRGRVRRRAQGTALSVGQQSNDLWCTDYKGEFLLGNHQYRAKDSTSLTKGFTFRPRPCALAAIVPAIVTRSAPVCFWAIPQPHFARRDKTPLGCYCVECDDQGNNAFGGKVWVLRNSSLRAAIECPDRPGRGHDHTNGEKAVKALVI
jgi:homeodomain-containing protein